MSSSVFRFLFSVPLAALAVASCATTSDPCSQSAVERRISYSLSDFARSNRADLNEVRQAVGYFEGQTVWGTMRIAQAVNAMRRVADGFEEEVVPDLVEISDQCGGVAPFREVFVDFLKDEGFNDQVVGWVEDFRFEFES